jgi:hypothetical protein
LSLELACSFVSIPIFVLKILKELSTDVVTNTYLPLTKRPYGLPRKLGLPMPAREDISFGLRGSEMSNAASELL